LVAVINLLISIGTFAINFIPVFQILKYTFISIITGIIITILASILPSVKAAKLAPMEAMRIE
jgi:ABC-type lipoprotein release transport system permease subunit